MEGKAFIELAHSQYINDKKVKTIEILKHTTPGDGGNIPIQATVDGLSVPGVQKPGLYTLKNVQITSNGTIQVTATAKTEWEVV